MRQVDVQGKLERIGEGQLSEVFRFNKNTALKLFRPGLAAAYAAHELAVTQAVFKAGLPVPRVGELVEAHGRFGFTLERVSGVLLLELLLKNPADVESVAQILADLQTQIHRTPAGLFERLPRQKEWWGNTIRDDPQISKQEQTAALTQLHQLPDGDRLCHGDFHPINIMIDEKGNGIVLDWFSAVSGHPLGDIAQTTLLLTEYPVPDTLAVNLPPVLRKRLCEEFLKRMLPTVGPKDSAEFPKWQRVVRTAARAFLTD